MNNLVDKRRYFNVDKTLYNIVGRRIDVETTSCVCGEQAEILLTSARFWIWVWRETIIF